MKKIAVLADYLEPSHHALIDSTIAADNVTAVSFFNNLDFLTYLSSFFY